MSVIIYGILPSPPVRGVLLTAKALGVEVEFKTCNIFEGDNKTEDYLKMNPARTVPTMDDDGFYLPESRAIMVYLVKKYAKDDKLYPQDNQQRAVVDSMLYFDAGTLFPSIVIHYGPQIRGGPTMPGSEAFMLEKVGILNTFLARYPYAAGDHVTLADLSIAATISLLEVAKLDFSPYPNITQWFSKIKQLPYYDEASKEGIDQLTALLASKLQK